LLTGQLGDSYAYSSPVLDLILERLALTVPLALLAMTFHHLLALVVGVVPPHSATTSWATSASWASPRSASPSPTSGSLSC
jgi:ABC-type dipeptide/oligopeptide/nickel transport system permease component